MSLTSYMDSHAGMAAWVQAIGALAIIWATAFIANRSSREAAKKELVAQQQLRESVAILARNCLSAIDAFLKESRPAGSTDPRGKILRAYAPVDFDVPMDGLAAVPLHQISDADLIVAILRLRGGMGRVKKYIEEIINDPVMGTSLEPVANLRTPVFNAMASVLRSAYGPAVNESELSQLAGSPW